MFEACSQHVRGGAMQLQLQLVYMLYILARPLDGVVSGVCSKRMSLSEAGGDEDQ
jgi:hypothetical protein